MSTKSEFSIDYDQQGDKDVSETAGKTDLIKLSGNIMSSVNYRLGAFTFIFGVLIMSDTFVDYLSTIPGMVRGECCTTQGALVQLILIVLVMLVLDLLIRAEWI